MPNVEVGAVIDGESRMLLKPLATDAELATAIRTQGDEVAGVSHSFLTD
jgi:hypothetical protein